MFSAGPKKHLPPVLRARCNPGSQPPGRLSERQPNGQGGHPAPRGKSAS